MVNKVVVYKDVTIFTQMQVNKSLFSDHPSLFFGKITSLSFDLQGVCLSLATRLFYGIFLIFTLYPITRQQDIVLKHHNLVLFSIDPYYQFMYSLRSIFRYKDPKTNS
ncbi:hypothetical protein GYB22_02475 [bacterium]|nr:hypothetical protein [bacterium]